MTAILTDRVGNPERVGVRKRFVLASLLGGIAAMILFAIVLQGGRDGLLGSDLLGNFYDGQARALFDGHLDVDPAVPGFEGFRIGDKTFIYQGLTPTLFRMPLLALTHSLDGRLTGLSMLVALGVTLSYISAASWRVRLLLRGLSPIGRAEMGLTAVATFGIGTGSILFLASRAWVYHEAQLWGVALSLGSLVHLTYWLSRQHLAGEGLPHPQPRAVPHSHEPVDGPSNLGWVNLVASVVLAGLALNTRSSIALGPIAALALVGALLFLGLITSKIGTDSSVSRLTSRLCGIAGWKPGYPLRRTLAAMAILILGITAGLGSYATVNHARFGSAFGVPLDRQMLVQNDPARREALAANNESLFGLQFAPSVAVQLLRPDALSVRGAFPYLGFPDDRPSVVGSAVFAERDWSSSVPSSEPLLFLGSLAGLVLLVAPRRLLGDSWGASGAAQNSPVLRIPVLGAAAGAAAILVFGYMAERYVSDLYPFLVLATIVGLHGLAHRIETSRRNAGGHQFKARAFAVVVIMSSIWGAWANSAVALQYQREIAPGFTAVGRDSWLDLQLSLPGSVPYIRVDSVDVLPEPSPKGTVAIVGNCAALYRSSGDVWYLVESGDSGDSSRVRIESGEALASRVSIATAQGRNGPIELSLVPISGDKARLDLPGSLVANGVEFDLNSNDQGGFQLDLDVVNDELDQTVTVIRHGTREELLRTFVTLADLTISEADSGPVRVAASPLPTELCRTLLQG